MVRTLVLDKDRTMLYNQAVFLYQNLELLNHLAEFVPLLLRYLSAVNCSIPSVSNIGSAEGHGTLQRIQV